MSKGRWTNEQRRAAAAARIVVEVSIDMPKDEDEQIPTEPAPVGLWGRLRARWRR